MLRLTINASGNTARQLLRLKPLTPKPSHIQPRIVFHKAVIDHQTTITGDIKTMILLDTQQVDLAIKPVDKKGNAAQVDGMPAWASSDPTIIDIVPAADGLSAVAKAGTLGHAQVTVTADADLGEGVKNISGTIEFDVVGGEAVSLSVITGTPVEQP